MYVCIYMYTYDTTTTNISPHFLMAGFDSLRGRGGVPNSGAKGGWDVFYLNDGGVIPYVPFKMGMSRWCYHHEMGIPSGNLT